MNQSTGCFVRQLRTLVETPFKGLQTFSGTQCRIQNHRNEPRRFFVRTIHDCYTACSGLSIAKWRKASIHFCELLLAAFPARWLGRPEMRDFCRIVSGC